VIRDAGDEWCSGSYAQRAQELLRAHAEDLPVLIAAYRSLARRAGSWPERMVITHGEPHAGNVIVTAGGLALIDWDTTLLAPPERDLWGLAEDGASLLGCYVAATGTEINDGALYRPRWDLAEVGGYLSQFRSPHEETADTRQSWKELQQFLRPAERWPALAGGPAAGR
jgi:spectinomycin phosphotransferase/16S rRNA (guanine(1405)-N(7))-methyltransferase